jgi:hypothetical protein
MRKLYRNEVSFEFLAKQCVFVKEMSLKSDWLCRTRAATFIKSQHIPKISCCAMSQLHLQFFFISRKFLAVLLKSSRIGISMVKEQVSRLKQSCSHLAKQKLRPSVLGLTSTLQCILNHQVNVDTQDDSAPISTSYLSPRPRSYIAFFTPQLAKLS